MPVQGPPQKRTPRRSLRISLTPTFLRRVRSNPHSIPLAIIALVILVVNLPTLVDLVSRNPLQLFAGIQTGPVHQALPGKSILDPNAGFITQAMGHLVATDWLHGHIPWWNPYEGLGSPLAGEMQAGAFFPPVFLLQDGLGFVAFHVLLELVAGGATFYLLRRLHLGRAASTAGGVAFGLCGTLAWFEHATANPVAFLPLALLGVERAREASLTSRRYGWRLLALALALSIVAGFPEVAYIDGLLVLVWALVRLFSVPGRRRAMTTKLALGGAFGVLLSAPALVAFVDYLPHANVGAHSGAFADGFLPIQSLAQVVLPYSLGPIFGFGQGASAPLLSDIWGTVGGYLDASLALCAFIGLLGARWRGLRIALALWVLIAMSKTFGVTPVVHLVNRLPEFHSIAFYRYSQTSWELAVVVLAALGIDDLARRRVRPALIVGAGVIALGVIAWAASEAWPIMSGVTGYAHAHAFIVASVVLAVLAVGLVVAGGILMYTRGSNRRPRIGQVLVAGAVILEAAVLFAAPLLSAPRPAKTDTALVHYLQRHLGLARFTTLGPISPNFGSFFGLSEINVNDLPVPKVFSTYVEKSLDTNTNPLIFTGTTKADAGGPGPAQELTTHLAAYEAAGVKFVVLSAPGIDVFGTPWPPAGLGHGLRRVYADSFFDVWQLPSPTPFFTTSGAPCRVRPGGNAAVEVTCSGPAVVRRLELPMPGWSAQVGSSHVTVRASGPFQSVSVGAGTTRIQYSFTPPYGDAALLAALAGALFLVGTFFVRRSRPRNRDAAVDTSDAVVPLGLSPEGAVPLVVPSDSDH
jgi:hypothetical protein